MKNQDYFVKKASTLQDLACLRGKKVVLGTICSGTEAPMFALEEWQRVASSRGNKFEVDHRFSCEIEPYKQEYIARNFDPANVFRDAETMGDDFAANMYGNLKPVPGCDVLVAGTSCKDCSSLNAHKQDLRDGRGESTRTYRGMLRYVVKHRPKIVILENVSGAPWKHMCNDFHGIGYDSSFTRADTKKFGIPQTRNRGYLVAIACKDGGVGSDGSVASEWVASMKRMQTPLTTTVDQYLFEADHPALRRVRRTWSAQRTVPKTVAWVRCQARHSKIRFDEKLGFERWLTNWTDHVKPQLLDVFWKDYFNTIQTNRVFDLLEINFLRELQQTGCDPRFKAIVWDLSQNPDRGGRSPFGITSCLTPRGMMFLTSRGGPIVGAEMLALQGLPADSLFFEVESEAELKDFAGNAMTVTVVGAALGAAMVLVADRFQSVSVESKRDNGGREELLQFGDVLSSGENVVSDRAEIVNGTFCHSCGGTCLDIATCRQCRTVRCMTCAGTSREPHHLLSFQNPVPSRYANSTAFTLNVQGEARKFLFTSERRGKHVFEDVRGERLVTDGQNWSAVLNGEVYACSGSPGSLWTTCQTTPEQASFVYSKGRARALVNVAGLRPDAFLSQKMKISCDGGWFEWFELVECCRDKSHNVLYRNERGDLFLHLDAGPITPNQEDCFVVTTVPYYHEESDVVVRFDPSWRPGNFAATAKCRLYTRTEQSVVSWADLEHRVNTTWRSIAGTESSVLCEVVSDDVCGKKADTQSGQWRNVESVAEERGIRWLLDTVSTEGTQWCRIEDDDRQAVHRVVVETEYLHDHNLLRKNPRQNDAYERQSRVTPRVVQRQRRGNDAVRFVFNAWAAKAMFDDDGARLHMRLRSKEMTPPRAVELSSNRSDPETDQPADFLMPLRPEQKRSLTWMLKQERGEGVPFTVQCFAVEECGDVDVQLMSTFVRHQRGGVLCDDVGYGKTVISLALHSHDRPGSLPPSGWTTNATLVVVPHHLARQWKDEVQKFLGKAAAKMVLVVRNVKQWKAVRPSDIRAARVVVVCEKVLRSREYWQSLSVHGGRILPDKTQAVDFEDHLVQEYGKMLERVTHDPATVESNARQEVERFLHQQGEAFVQPTVLHGRSLQETRMFGEKDGWERRGAVGAADVAAKQFLRRVEQTVRGDGGGLPLELFRFRRIVVDEFTYLRGLSRVVVAKGLRSDARWILSATASFDTPEETCVVSNLLFGLDQVVGRQDALTVEYAQSFVDKFVRKNVAEIDEIPTDTHLRGIDLSFYERTLYIENVVFCDVPTFQHRQKRARTSAVSTTEKLVTLLNCSDLNDAQRLLEERRQRVVDDRAKVEALVRRALIMEAEVELDEDHTWTFWRRTECRSGDPDFDTAVAQMLQCSASPTTSSDEPGTTMLLRELTHVVRAQSKKFLSSIRRLRFLERVMRSNGDGTTVRVSTGEVVVDSEHCPKRRGGETFVADEPLTSCEVGGTKCNRIAELLSTNAAKGEKSLVLVQYESLFDRLVEHFERCGLQIAHKSKHLNRFQQNKDFDVLLVRANETVSGLNLTNANHIVFVHPLFLLEKEKVAQETQFIGRCVRYGQERVVHVHRFVANNTLETL